jgi:hypothetical protein
MSMQKNYADRMRKKNVAAITFFSVAVMIVLSWFALCSYDEFFKLGTKGIHPSSVSALPKPLQFFYKGFPNLSTLLCYILLTLAAFMTIKEKKKLLLLINITSFAMIVWLLFLLS